MTFLRPSYNEADRLTLEQFSVSRKYLIAAKCKINNINLMAELQP